MGDYDPNEVIFFPLNFGADPKDMFMQRKAKTYPYRISFVNNLGFFIRYITRTNTNLNYSAFDM